MSDESFILLPYDHFVRKQKEKLMQGVLQRVAYASFRYTCDYEDLAGVSVFFEGSCIEVWLEAPSFDGICSRIEQQKTRESIRDLLQTVSNSYGFTIPVKVGFKAQ